MKKFAKLAAAAAIAGMAMAAQAGIVIDDFSVGQGLTGGGLPITLSDNTNDGIGKYNSVSGPIAKIIGGERDMFITKIGIGAGAIATVDTYVDSGTLFYSTASGAAGRSITKWDGVNDAAAGATTAGSELAFMGTLNPLGLGGLDLKATGTGFLINVQEADLGFDFALTVYTSATQWTTLVLASVAHAGGLPASSSILFSDFEGATCTIPPNFALCAAPSLSGARYFTGAGGAADLSNVGALVSTVNFSGATTKIDLEIRDVITVPEPGSLALVGVALLGVAAARRRKSAAK